MESMNGTAIALAVLSMVVSLCIVVAVVASPYVLLFFLSRQISGDSWALRFRVAGLVVSSGVALASVALYAKALYALSHSSSSTAGLVFLVVPVLLAVVAGPVYGVIVVLHAWFRKSNARA
jgi:hypothetical protein